MASVEPAMYVLEVNAGLTDTWNLIPGDKVEWTLIQTNSTQIIVHKKNPSKLMKGFLFMKDLA